MTEFLKILLPVIVGGLISSFTAFLIIKKQFISRTREIYLVKKIEAYQKILSKIQPFITIDKYRKGYSRYVHPKAFSSLDMLDKSLNDLDSEMDSNYIFVENEIRQKYDDLKNLIISIRGESEPMDVIHKTIMSHSL